MPHSRQRLTGIGFEALGAFLLVRTLYLSGATEGIDSLALKLTQGWKDGPAGRLSHGAARLGSEGLLPVATVGALAMSGSRRWRRAALPFLVLSVSNLCNLALKRKSARVRPPGEELPIYLFAWDRYAFPSGHAMNSAALFGLLALWSQRSLPGPVGGAVSISLGLVPLLIGFSRVILRVHWLSDVIAGWLGGIAVMSLIAAASDPALSDETAQQRGGSADEL